MVSIHLYTVTLLRKKNKLLLLLYKTDRQTDRRTDRDRATDRDRGTDKATETDRDRGGQRVE